MSNVQNRNTVCGQRKEEILFQLREMVKLEPDCDQDKEDVEPSSRFQSLVPDRACRQLYTSFESKKEPTFYPSYKASAFQWCNDVGEDADESLPNTSYQSYFNTECLVPDKDPEVDPTLHYEENKHETPSQNPVITEASQIIPKAAPHEFSSQHRDSAITRYKEKRKSRRVMVDNVGCANATRVMDEDAFFTDYAESHMKLSELGFAGSFIRSRPQDKIYFKKLE